MLIIVQKVCYASQCYISIHLMLMLIINPTINLPTSHNFNTSHVNVNQEASTQAQATILISIHLMLMLICTPTGSPSFSIIISIHLMLMLIVNYNHLSCILADFNTSHVNVNRDVFGMGKTNTKFQYISC